MKALSSILLAFMLTFPVSAMDLKQIQIPQLLTTKQQKECKRNLDFYTRMVGQFPDESYYRFMLNKWQKRCK